MLVLARDIERIVNSVARRGQVRELRVGGERAEAGSPEGVRGPDPADSASERGAVGREEREGRGGEERTTGRVREGDRERVGGWERNVRYKIRRSGT